MTRKPTLIQGVFLFFFGIVLSACGGGGSSAPAQAASGVTVDQLAGTWDYMAAGAEVVNSTVCAGSISGVATLGASGATSLSETVHTTCGDFSRTAAGTTAVGAAGGGTITLPDRTINIQVSKDLNAMIIGNIATAGVYTSGTALRR